MSDLGELYPQLGRAHISGPIGPVPATPPPPPSMRVPLMPPLLEKRMKEHGIELPRFAAVFDRIFVYPLESRTQPGTTTGGIIVPEMTKQKLVAQLGVLIMAGPKAIEELYSHGVSLGDVVCTARLSPWERTYYSKTNRPHRILVLRAAEVVGSEDLLEQYERGDLYQEMDHQGRVTIASRERIDPPQGDEGI